ncbi:MAG TPA: YkgJ family cysteine cluster protein [Phycisphaerales bacterium]|nr:YkgJ family cysteine cluster protein [Phycisphaerales bacterium]
MPNASPTPPEWFATPDPERGRDGTGLSFSCTMCGNCCSGPAGYIIVSDDEIAALAKRLKVTVAAFTADYTHMSEEGRSLNEKKSAAGLDCIFLDREKIPGKAVCGVYEDRPIQCRTWPFWPSVIKTRQTWERAKRTCPGIDNGKKHTLVQIRIARDTFDI